MSDPTPLDILRGTKAALERNGWTQHDYIDGQQHANGTPIADCRVDLNGALRIATTGDPIGHDSRTASEARALLLRLIGETGSPYMGLASWNDEDDRTVEDVYTLLDTAIKHAEAGGHHA